MMNTSNLSKDKDLEWIVNEIEEIFQSSTNFIRYVDFIPSKEPPFVIFAENTLGIAYGIVKPLFSLLYSALMEGIRQKRKKLNGISDYRLEVVSRMILLLKGDLTIAYNFRKSLILNNPKLLSNEIPLTSIIFSKHPKSPSGWEHRRWCYKLRSCIPNVDLIFSSSPPVISLAIMEIATESELCRDMVDKYPRNYYAWMHRLWLLPHLADEQLEEEFLFLRSWIRMHPSDHSAANHLVQFLYFIFKKRHMITNVSSLLSADHESKLPEDLRFLFYLLVDSDQLITSEYCMHYSLWQYKKLLFLMSHQIATLPSVSNQAIIRSELIQQLCNKVNLLLELMQTDPQMVVVENHSSEVEVTTHPEFLVMITEREIMFIVKLLQKGSEDYWRIIETLKNYIGFLLKMLLKSVRDYLTEEVPRLEMFIQQMKN